MPPVLPRWYLYCCLLLVQLLLLVFTGLCSWHTSKESETESWVYDVALQAPGDGSNGKIPRFEENSKSISSSADLVSCEDLKGFGSFDTTCLVNSNVYLNSSIYARGTGNLEFLPQISIACPIQGCSITFNLSGNVKVGSNATIVAGSVIIAARSLSVGYNSSINTTSLGGSPPPQTSGTPVGYEGAGGGHGGRGASCLKNDQKMFGEGMFTHGPTCLSHGAMEAGEVVNLQKTLSAGMVADVSSS